MVGNSADDAGNRRHFDVIVVGAGFGGLYSIFRMKQQGLAVIGLESASGVGGVWYHNQYPGARVDVQSSEYCYFFSPELYGDWHWSERFAAGPEILRYMNHVTDRFDLRRHIRFDTRMAGATWHPDDGRYHVETSTGHHFTSRFLIMATGNLSAARKPDFPGLDQFKGEWVQTSQWPNHPVAIAGRRIAVVGTGSSGVQTISTVTPLAEHVYVIQRSPNYSVPARNGPMDALAAIDVPKKRAEMLATKGGLTSGIQPVLPYAQFSEPERLDRLERQWSLGGQGMNRVFADQGTNPEVNAIVSEFVRNKIRAIVTNPEVAELLAPKDHPIGSRRVCVDTGYYETFNRDNITLVDIRDTCVECVTENSIRFADGREIEVDLIIFAIGFDAFRGALDRANIRNEKGEAPTDRWNRGPRTLLGLMTNGFPNLFFLTGPGSPSVLSNMVLMNEEHVNWVADLIAKIDADGYDTIEPTLEAEAQWCEAVADAARPLLRLSVKNYMVHVNQDDGSRVFMPYVGGFDRYLAIAGDIAARGYEGFALGRISAQVPHDLSRVG